MSRSHNPDGEIHSIRCQVDRGYGLQLTEDVLSPEGGALGKHLQKRRSLIVTTPTVFAFYGAAVEHLIQRRALDATVLVLPCSEEQKSLRELEVVCQTAIKRQLDRNGLLVGLGGGVCTDIVSVAASMIRRGVGCVRVPTTLIGQIDAGIGLKGAVNFNGKKSYLGCFFPPEAVYIDPAFLSTLPRPYFAFGFAEIIKMALVRDRGLFDLVERHHAELTATRFSAPRDEGRRIIHLAAKRMLEELGANPYENLSYQRLVDLGHTFSPSLEQASSFTLHHGAAVAIDLALTVTLAEELGVLAKAERDRVVRLLRNVGLPTYCDALTPARCRESLEDVVLHRGGQLNFVLPDAIGSARFLERPSDLPEGPLEAAIQRLDGEHREAKVAA